MPLIYSLVSYGSWPSDLSILALLLWFSPSPLGGLVGCYKLCFSSLMFLICLFNSYLPFNASVHFHCSTCEQYRVAQQPLFCYCLQRANSCIRTTLCGVDTRAHGKTDQRGFQKWEQELSLVLEYIKILKCSKLQRGLSLNLGVKIWNFLAYYR